MVFIQVYPDQKQRHQKMAEDAQSRVQSAVKSFVNDIDKTHLRKLVKCFILLKVKHCFY